MCAAVAMEKQEPVGERGSNWGWGEGWVELSYKSSLCDVYSSVRGVVREVTFYSSQGFVNILSVAVFKLGETFSVRQCKRCRLLSVVSTKSMVTE